MSHDEHAKQASRANTMRVLVDAGAFLAGWALGWVVFDNIALALVFALIFSSASEAVQRGPAKKSD